MLKIQVKSEKPDEKDLNSEGHSKKTDSDIPSGKTTTEDGAVEIEK